jgi:putative transposase
VARLPRLVVPGQAHYLVLRGLAGRAVFVDAQDRASFLAALREAATTHQVLVHAWALLEAEVQLLVAPSHSADLGRLVQAIGRRYAAALNRRLGRSGPLWDGRYRCAVVEPGSTLLAALRLIDGLSVESGVTSASARTGGPRDPLLTDPPEFWQLGNTPFERESAYRALLEAGLAAEVALALRSAALGNWAAGSQAFAAHLGGVTPRPVRPRAKGRPLRRAPKGQTLA